MTHTKSATKSFLSILFCASTFFSIKLTLRNKPEKTCLVKLQISGSYQQKKKKNIPYCHSPALYAQYLLLKMS